jgi:hypothetical protein
VVWSGELADGDGVKVTVRGVVGRGQVEATLG